MCHDAAVAPRQGLLKRNPARQGARRAPRVDENSSSLVMWKVTFGFLGRRGRMWKVETGRGSTIKRYRRKPLGAGIKDD